MIWPHRFPAPGSWISHLICPGSSRTDGTRSALARTGRTDQYQLGSQSGLGSNLEIAAHPRCHVSQEADTFPDLSARPETAAPVADLRHEWAPARVQLNPASRAAGVAAHISKPLAAYQPNQLLMIGRQPFGFTVDHDLDTHAKPLGFSL